MRRVPLLALRMASASQPAVFSSARLTTIAVAQSLRPRPCVRHVATNTTSTQTTSSSFTIPPILFVTGGPGAGKGTQCSLLVREFAADVRGEDGNDAAMTTEPLQASSAQLPSSAASPSRLPFGVAHISVGAVLRKSASLAHTLSPADRELVTTTLAAGGILPGNLTVQLLRSEFQRVVRAQEAIDPQRKLCFLVDGFPRTMDNVMEFRRQCGEIGSLLYLTCDEKDMMHRLSVRGRSDDKPEIIQRRIVGFQRETMPVVEWFKGQVQEAKQSTSPPQLLVVDGRPSIDEVWPHVREAFGVFLMQRVGVDLPAATRS
jgi:UMP-CMP kinase